MGFIASGQEEKQVPECIICGEKLSHESMVPSKLNRHFLSKHSHLKGKNPAFFERMLREQKQTGMKFHKTMTVPEKALECSFIVSQMIAKQLKSHDIGEKLIKPACLEMVQRMVGEEVAKEIEKVPLSNNTVTRRVGEMSSDIRDHTLDKIKSNPFAIQLDESTDYMRKCYLIAFVRFVLNNDICNQFLFLEEMKTTTTGKDVFKATDTFFAGQGLSWENCVGICTDGAPSMTGSLKGFVTLAKEKNPEIISTHCFIHREALMKRTLDAELQSVLDDAVKMVNKIKGKALKSRLFSELCESMDANFTCLLYHSEVRWLSRGKVLKRLYDLKEELMIFFLQEGDDHCSDLLADDDWRGKLAYLADIFEYLNSLNTNLQGPSENVITSTDKLTAFKEKIKYWIANLNAGKTGMFPLFTAEENQNSIEIVKKHLQSLESNLKSYFPHLDVNKYNWIQNPFLAMPDTDNFKLQGEAIELKNDRNLRLKFEELCLNSFWIYIETEYPLLSKEALKVLLQFSTSWLCEHGFSALTNIKTKRRGRMLGTNLEASMRLCLSTIPPRITKLCKEHQAHPDRKSVV